MNYMVPNVGFVPKKVTQNQQQQYFIFLNEFYNSALHCTWFRSKERVD